MDFYTDSYSCNQTVVRCKTYEAIVMKFGVYINQDPLQPKRSSKTDLKSILQRILNQVLADMRLGFCFGYIVYKSNEEQSAGDPREDSDADCAYRSQGR